VGCSTEFGLPRRGQAGSPNGVTGRALLLSFFLIALLAPAGFYIELIVGYAYDFNTQSPPIAPLGVLFLLAMANLALARRWRGLSRREMLVIYIVVSVSVPLIAHGTMLWFLSCSIGIRAYGQVFPDWEPTFFRYLPPWFCPTTPRAVEGFFQGDAAPPWALWRTPLVAWGGFFFALFTANLSLLLLFRRQWVTNERLSFPIAQVPLESIREGPEAVGRLSGAAAFWLGLGGILFLGLVYRLSTIFPSIPSIPLGDYVLIPWVKTGPLAGIGDVLLALYPWCIGLAYLIPKDLSLSVWFFWFVRVALTVAAIAAGATPMKPQDYWGTEFPAPYYQGGGAVIALGVLAFWTGRHHLARTVRLAIASRSEDGEAPLAYRWAALCLLLSIGYMVAFCMAAGSRLVVAAALASLIVAYHMVWARLRAENGMSFIGFPYTVGSVMTEPFGTVLLRPNEVVTINAVAWTYWPGWGEGCEVITGASLDALKISDSARIRQRPLLLAMCGGFLFALVLGMVVALTGVYRQGFWNLHIWNSWLPITMRNRGADSYEAIANPGGFNLAASLPLAAGMAVTFLLAALRLRFWWWPLHPVGYLAANVWGTQSWYMPFLIGWLLKTLVIRYGGLRLYQRTMPAAIGVVIGDRFLDFTWPLVLALIRS